ncbi:zinc finger protein 271-like isoform X2 [Folsomia candida]|uniref:zinc finger protein 271-like isoform X2 n=1 Tax=Folsomia candida TaxID=158441 RepID=UPI001604FC76|nr:zinc finger protein 271-like isoform X2 [Folsomia candida]
MKPGKKWECTKCSKMFHTKRDLTLHMVTHDPDAKVKCEVCGKISKNILALRCHMWGLHSNRKRPSCDACHRVFSTSTFLRLHIDAAHSAWDRLRFPCTVLGCEKTYQDKGSLGHHVRIEHAENPVRYPCILCEKDFKRKGDLEKHIPTHTTEKAHNCVTCGRSFAHRWSMKRHEIFLNRSALQHHIRVTHENRRNNPCDFCDKKFSKPSELKRRVEARHPVNKELVHSCDRCEYKSYSKANLTGHRKRHNPAKHGCYFCDKKFVIFAELVSHCRVHTLEKKTYFMQ